MDFLPGAGGSPANSQPKVHGTPLETDGGIDVIEDPLVDPDGQCGRTCLDAGASQESDGEEFVRGIQEDFCFVVGDGGDESLVVGDFCGDIAACEVGEEGGGKFF